MARLVKSTSGRIAMGLGVALSLSACVTNLASGPWPSSSDSQVIALAHPTWESHQKSLGSDAEHRMVFFGDQRALADGEWQAMIEAIVLREEEMAGRSPLVGVIDSGDIVFNGNYTDQFNMLGEILTPLREWPYLVGVGNHEVHSNRGIRARRNVVDFLGPTLGSEITLDRLYYRKDAPGHHLLFLDSNDLVYGADGSRGDELELDDRGQEQMSWLVRELDSLDPMGLITVVLHHPFVISSTKHEANAQKLWSLRYEGRTLPQILAEGGVDLVIAGHTHTYERFEIRTQSGPGFALINVSGRPRSALMGFGKGGRKARLIRGGEVSDLAKRGWRDLDGWRIEQLDAMVEIEANQWLELRVVPDRSLVGELFYLERDLIATSGGAFVIR